MNVLSARRLAQSVLALVLGAMALPAALHAQPAPLPKERLQGRELECIAGLSIYGLFLSETAKDPGRSLEDRQDRAERMRDNDRALFWFLGRVADWPEDQRSGPAFGAALARVRSLDPDTTIAFISGCDAWFQEDGLGSLQRMVL